MYQSEQQVIIEINLYMVLLIILGWKPIDTHYGNDSDLAHLDGMFLQLMN